MDGERRSILLSNNTDDERRSSLVSAVSLANQYRLSQTPKRPEKKRIVRRKKSLENCEEEQERHVTDRHLSDAGQNSWLMNIDEEEFDFDAEEDCFFDPAPDAGSQPHQIYTQACTGLDVRPVRCIYEALKNDADKVTCRSLVLKHGDVQACTIALVGATAVESLEFDGNLMGKEGAEYFGDVLNKNRYLTSIRISYNALGTPEAEAICRALLKNMSVKILDLTGNSFNENDAKYFKELLETNSTIRELRLGHNYFREAGGEQIGEGLDISRKEYQRAIKNGQTLHYVCVQCQVDPDDEVDEHLENSSHQSAEVPEAISFQLISGGTLRGKDKLVDSDGRSYTVKERHAHSKTWTCSTRTRKLKCPATVTETDDGTFKRNSKPHICPTPTTEPAVRNVATNEDANEEPMETGEESTEASLTVEIYTAADDTDMTDTEPAETAEPKEQARHPTRQLCIPVNNSTFSDMMTDATMADVRPDNSNVIDAYVPLGHPDVMTEPDDPPADHSVDADMTEVTYSSMTQNDTYQDSMPDNSVNVTDEDMAQNTSAVDDMNSDFGGDTALADGDVTETNRGEVNDDDVSFNVSTRSINDTLVIQERSLEDPEMSDSVVEDAPVTFEIFENGSKRGGRKLVSSDGYSYTFKKSTESTTYWRCSVRSDKTNCSAMVIQQKDSFTLGKKGHIHPADPGLMNKIKSCVKVKKIASDEKLRPAQSIVETVMGEVCNNGAAVNKPKPDNLRRMVNRSRQATRPKEPKDLTFEVFQKIKEAVGDPDVEGFVLDFEAAAWTALRQVFPGIPIKGCVFHWTQAVWRKVQDLGLRTAYCQREADYLYIKKLLALPFLPHSHIEEAFNQLATMARSEQMKALCSYIETTWMESPVWNVRSWSIFKQEVRTNNDVEGYHNRLNQKAGKANLTFYVLVPLLRAESDLVTLQMTLVQENLLTRRHRREYAELQNQLDVLWEEYSVKLITTSELLKRCGKIYGPTD